MAVVVNEFHMEAGDRSTHRAQFAALVASLQVGDDADFSRAVELIEITNREDFKQRVLGMRHQWRTGTDQDFHR